MNEYLPEVPFMAELTYGDAWENPKDKTYGFIENRDNIVDMEVGGPPQQ